MFNLRPSIRFISFIWSFANRLFMMRLPFMSYLTLCSRILLLPRSPCRAPQPASVVASTAETASIVHLRCIVTLHFLHHIDAALY